MTAVDPNHNGRKCPLLRSVALPGAKAILCAGNRFKIGDAILMPVMARGHGSFVAAI